MTRRGLRGGLCSYRRPQAAIGDERFTSQGSQQPPGSPLSREEGEAPPPAPAPEGRRRSRRVRLRGSCSHRPSFLGRRELATSAPARPAPASCEVSEIGNNGVRGSEGLGQPELPSGARPRDERAERPGRPSLGEAGDRAGGTCGTPVDLFRWVGEGLRFQEALPRGASIAVYWKELGLRGKKPIQNKRSSLNRGISTVRRDLEWVLRPL